MILLAVIVGVIVAVVLFGIWLSRRPIPQRPGPIGFVSHCDNPYSGEDCDYPMCDCGKPIYEGDKEESRY